MGSVKFCLILKLNRKCHILFNSTDPAERRNQEEVSLWAEVQNWSEIWWSRDVSLSVVLWNTFFFLNEVIDPDQFHLKLPAGLLISSWMINQIVLFLLQTKLFFLLYFLFLHFNKTFSLVNKLVWFLYTLIDQFVIKLLIVYSAAAVHVNLDINQSQTIIIIIINE